MDRIIKTDKGIPKITLDHYPDKPLYKTETNDRYSINNDREYPTATTSREQVSYKNKRG